MAHANAISPFEQLSAAILRLPREQKVRLWQLLDKELAGRDIDKEFDDALRSIWSANAGVTEDEVMADALAAIREFRAETATSRP